MNLFYEAMPNAAGSLLPFVSTNGLMSFRLCRIPLWVFNPFQMSIDSSLLKGLKPTEEEAMPLSFINRQLKQTAKESLRHGLCSIKKIPW